MLDSLEVTISSADAPRSARFWGEALGYRILYHRAPYVVLGPGTGSGPRVVVQQVDPPTPAPGAVHLDLRVDDPVHEVQRLVALGARVLEEVAEAGRRWTVLADPEGAVFCVCPARTG